MQAEGLDPFGLAQKTVGRLGPLILDEIPEEG